MNPIIFQKMSKSPDSCYGCRACEQICESDAITMMLDHEGFLYPVFNESMCIQCGLCDRVCPNLITPTKRHKTYPLKVLAAWAKEKKDRSEATSGGLFLAIATEVISRGGVVFGVAYDKSWNLYHSMARTIEDCLKFRGSKYAQSDTRNTFKEAQKFLESGIFVYYTGTPCQIAGLRSFLRKDYSNLLTSDIICHGTPSNKLFMREIMWKEEHEPRSIDTTSYRSKDRFGWGYDWKITWNDGKTQYFDTGKSPYFVGFWNNSTLRPACYSCKFASINRQGDITLGDFWGVKKHVKKIRRTGSGVSMLLVNSQRGLDVISELKRIEVRISNIQTALKTQAHLSKPVSRPEARDGVYDRAYEDDYDSFSKVNLSFGSKAMVKRQIRNWIKLAVLWKYLK
ncbi:Coenzyme F420 hydrogenase/dehydrogenase, beta subunit C-terminal domain [Desulfoluna butyratoxydans]|uniref:Coenzyme f420 hydrogenase/dehydrogenase beta subunit n-term n=1 Tax=Desulfoluna butyratoxydans TaxID=231438 RepID=A0A4U8YQN2_9BACT|nr:Coenzyme F420 hydrogenase/dehydrogenase, beta subunit C-terminal domain [Desulfoluna butyratoxydans]VFQ46556.1 coenzyme f420 hydrogenase/dehydrogenase beta subunit n-term [Desulfoluna butyratoxydans]